MKLFLATTKCLPCQIQSLTKKLPKLLLVFWLIKTSIGIITFFVIVKTCDHTQVPICMLSVFFFFLVRLFSLSCIYCASRGETFLTFSVLSVLFLFLLFLSFSKDSLERQGLDVERQRPDDFRPRILGSSTQGFFMVLPWLLVTIELTSQLLQGQF